MKSPHILTMFLAASALALTSVNAQTTTTVTSDIVGYVTTKISSGYNAIGSTFVKGADFSGTVSSATTNSLTLSGDPSLDTSSNTYYVEVISSSANLVGERIDVASVSGNVVTLDTSASHNTIDDVSAFPVNTAIVIRAHFTVGDLNTLLGSNVNSDDQFTAAGSDQLLFFDNGAFRTHIEYAGVWYENFGDNLVVTNKIIAPGSGFFYYRNPTAGTPSDIDLTTSGAVRDNAVALKLNPGYQFVSSAYPVGISPAELQLNGNLQASVNFDVNESDLILTWDKSAQSFRTHLLYADTSANNWYQNFGDNNVVDNNDIIGADTAALVFIRGNNGQVLEVPRPF